MSKTIPEKILALSEKGKLCISEPSEKYNPMDMLTHWYVGIQEKEGCACIVDHSAKTLTEALDGCIKSYNTYVDNTQKISL